MKKLENKYDLLKAVYQTEISKTAKSIFQFLVFRGDNRRCFVSVETIATALNASKRTIQRNMRALENTRFIIVKERWYNNEQLTNEYLFNFDYIEKEEYEVDYKKNDKEKTFSKIDYISNTYKTELTLREKSVLIYFAHRANQSGIAYDNLSNIARDLSMHRITLNKILKKLVRLKKICIFGCQGNIQVELMQHIQEEQIDHIEKKKDNSEIVQVKKEHNRLYIHIKSGIKYIIKSIKQLFTG